MHGMNSKQPLRFSLEIIKIFMFLGPFLGF